MKLNHICRNVKTVILWTPVLPDPNMTLIYVQIESIKAEIRVS